MKDLKNKNLQQILNQHVESAKLFSHVMATVILSSIIKVEYAKKKILLKIWSKIFENYFFGNEI